MPCCLQDFNVWIAQSAHITSLDILHSTATTTITTTCYLPTFLNNQTFLCPLNNSTGQVLLSQFCRRRIRGTERLRYLLQSTGKQPSPDSILCLSASNMSFTSSSFSYELPCSSKMPTSLWDSSVRKILRDMLFYSDSCCKVWFVNDSLFCLWSLTMLHNLGASLGLGSE